MKKDMRSSFLAPFRADRATAVSDIIVRVAADDLRQKAAAEAHGMSVYAWSAFLAVRYLRLRYATVPRRRGRSVMQSSRVLLPNQGLALTHYESVLL